MLTYSFDKRLIAILEDSRIWGRLELPVLMAFTSKYSVSLYENSAQFIRLEHKTMQEYSLKEFRGLLGLPEDKYPRFGELNKHVIKPIVQEINALAAFYVALAPIKEGRKVTRIRLTWTMKNEEELKAAYAEVRRPRFGRKARIKGTVEHLVMDPMPAMKGPQHIAEANRKQGW